MSTSSTEKNASLNDVPRPLAIGHSRDLIDAVPGSMTTVGRHGELVVGHDNPYMHRKLLTFHTEGADDDTWVISNVGRFITVTIAPEDGSHPVSLPPGDSTFVRWHEFTLSFTAGDEVFHLDCRADIREATEDLALTGTSTIIPETLSPEECRLLAVLAKPIMASPGLDYSLVPKNRTAAEALGLSTKQFDHRLDALCRKFAAAGISGLIGSSGELASNRRVKIVQFAIESQLVSQADLAALP